MEYDQSNPHYKKPDYYSYNPETAEGTQPDSLGVHPSQKKKDAIIPNLLQPESPHKNLPPQLRRFNPDPNAPKLPHKLKLKPFTVDTRPKDLNPIAPDLSPMLIAGAIPMPVEGPLLPELGEAAATAAKVLLTPLTELGAAGAAAVMGGATAIVGGEGIFHSLNEGEAEYLRKNAALLKSQHQTTPAPNPAQPHVSAPAANPIAAPVSMPRTPAKAQFPAAEMDQPSALDLQIQQQRKAQAAQAKQEEAKQKKQNVAWKTLQTEQSKLNDFNAGYSLSGSDLEAFSQGLTPQQRQAVQAQATARNAKLTDRAKEAGVPLSKDEIQQQQQQIEQRVLYEQYTPAREIYHFAGQFLNGYTPQKMQAVRGYFDGVFAGTYPKAIPAEKRGAIESSADAKYTAETGQKADRESPLWKTLRNIEASEKYPDLWDGFRNDLSASEQTGVLKTMTNPNDPSLGSNALNRPSQGSTLSVPIHTGHPAGEGQQRQQPVGGGFDNTVNPELVKPLKGFPTNQHVDGVANVFEYTTDYRKNYEQVHGPIPAGTQIHHIAPRAVFDASPLAQEWVRRGLTKLDYPENLEALPQTKDAYDTSSIKIQHSGSHDAWSRHATDILEQAQKKLAGQYGSLDKVPDDVMKQTKDDVMQQLREDLLDKDLGLKKGWVQPKPSGMDKLSQTQISDQIG
jgi:A nuclease family of the HNH/ENDO VII superfamily with conserved AHH